MTRLGGCRVRNPAVCASIMGDDLEAMEESLEEAIEGGADIVELRLDRLDDASGWDVLIPEEVPTIVTVRSGEEGGYFDGSESERKELLKEAIEKGASCVDVELSTSPEIVEEVSSAASSAGTSLILSFHDFEGVPSFEELVEKVEEMSELGCDFAKVICFAKEPQDSLEVLDFLIRVSEDYDLPVISFAMGDVGGFTRVAAPLLGSPLTYSSVGEKAAPGQFDLSETKAILDRFRD